MRAKDGSVDRNPGCGRHDQRKARAQPTERGRIAPSPQFSPFRVSRLKTPRLYGGTPLCPDRGGEGESAPPAGAPPGTEREAEDPRVAAQFRHAPAGRRARERME